MIVIARFLLVAVSLFFSLQTLSAQPESAENAPLLWRQFIPGSATTKAIFIARSPQFILYQNGYLVYREPGLDADYQEVQLTPRELTIFMVQLEQTYHLSGVSQNRLQRETPYIRSVQKPLKGDTSSIALWFGMYTPPRLHQYSAELLEARSDSEELGPAWKALYQSSQYLSNFKHPRAKALVPKKIELAIQKAPALIIKNNPPTVAWPLEDMPLSKLKGPRKRSFQALEGKNAQRVYTLLSTSSIVMDNGEAYQVWARPLLLPE